MGLFFFFLSTFFFSWTAGVAAAAAAAAASSSFHDNIKVSMYEIMNLQVLSSREKFVNCFAEDAVVCINAMPCSPFLPTLDFMMANMKSLTTMNDVLVETNDRAIIKCHEFVEYKNSCKTSYSLFEVVHANAEGKISKLEMVLDDKQMASMMKCDSSSDEENNVEL